MKKIAIWFGVLVVVIAITLVSIDWVYAVAFAATILILATSSPWFINWLADGDVLFAKVPEGTARAIVAGKSFHGFISSVRGKRLNDPHKDGFDGLKPSWELLDDPTPERGGLLRGWFGVFFVGIPPFRIVYKYRFQWNEFRPNEKGADEIWPRDMLTSIVYCIPFPYAMTLSEAETSEGLPLNVTYQVTVVITNPFKALFQTENWMEQMSAAVSRAVRNYVGSRTYEQLLSETNKNKDGESEINDNFSRPLTVLSKKLLDDVEEGLNSGLAGRFGVTILSAELFSVAVAGPTASKLLDATTAEYVAEKTAKAVVIAAKAEAEAITAKGNAEAGVIRTKGEAAASALIARINAIGEGEVGKLLAQLDAMSAEGPGKTVVWANSPFLPESIPSLLNTLGIKSGAQLRKFLNESGGNQ